MRRIWVINSTKQAIIDKHTPLIQGLKGKKRNAATAAMTSEIKEARSVAVNAALIDADLNNCPEIVWGVPPVLATILKGKKLPRLYEEPESPASIPPRDLEREFDDLKVIVNDLVAKGG